MQRSYLRPRALHLGRVSKARWRPHVLSLLTALLAFVGLVLLTYPTAASWITQYNQSKIVQDYSRAVELSDPKPFEQIRRAHEYNAALNSGAVLEANTNIPTGAGRSSDESLDYFSLLNATPTGLIGRIRIPSIDLDLPIFHGTSDQVLESGIGHLQGTSLPVGGIDTRTVLTGHRGLANAEMFTNLDKVANGDTFSIEVFDQVIVYRVVDIKIVDPSQTEAIRVEPGRDLATLVTCTPLGINSHRILLTGERILPTPQKEIERVGEKPAVPFFPWWILWFTVGTLLIGVYVWRSGYPVMRLRRKSQFHAAQSSPSVVKDDDS